MNETNQALEILLLGIMLGQGTKEAVDRADPDDYGISRHGLIVERLKESDNSQLYDFLKLHGCVVRENEKAVDAIKRQCRTNARYKKLVQKIKDCHSRLMVAKGDKEVLIEDIHKIIGEACV